MHTCKNSIIELNYALSFSYSQQSQPKVPSPCQPNGRLPGKGKGKGKGTKEKDPKGRKGRQGHCEYKQIHHQLKNSKKHPYTCTYVLCFLAGCKEIEKMQSYKMHSTRSHMTWLSNTCQSCIRAQNIAMDLFWDLLCQRDIRGSYQCQVGDRCNLILTNLSDFEEKACKATLLYPEGQSAAMLLSNQEFQPRKTAWDNSVLVLDISSRNKMTDLKSHNDNIEFWVFNVLDKWNVAHESDAQYLLDDETEIVPIARTKKGTLKVLELFCGGYGGWRSSFEFLHDHFQIDAQIFGIDKDLHAIQTYAATNKTVLVNGMQNLPWKFFKDFTQHAAIHADIHSFIQMACSRWNVETRHDNNSGSTP